MYWAFSLPSGQVCPDRLAMRRYPLWQRGGQPQTLGGGRCSLAATPCCTGWHVNELCEGQTRHAGLLVGCSFAPGEALLG
jgi:hypothetical protein